MRSVKLDAFFPNVLNLIIMTADVVLIISENDVMYKL